MASVYKRGGKGPYIVAWVDHSGRRREKSSRTTDKRAAERIAAQLEADAALRREGVVDARADRYAEAGRRPLTEHLDEYEAHLRHVGRSERHVGQVSQTLGHIADGAGASRLGDLTLDSVEAHLGGLREAGRSARTVNYARAAAVAFMGWCEQTARVERNELKRLERLDEQRDRRRPRRALTDAEIGRLLVVADRHGRRPFYLLAALTGLRRSELASLTWGDVDLDAGTLTVSRGKARRVDVLPLHPQIAEELRAIEPELAHPKRRVFDSIPSNARRRKDYEEAEIAHIDDSGRVADLHSLRSSLATALARQGAVPQVIQRLMRHASFATTAAHYTRLSLVDDAAALAALRPIGSEPGEAATGTAGLDAASTQHEPQQSGHDAPRERATRCEGDAGGGGSASRRNSLPAAALCDAVQPDAPKGVGSPSWTRTNDPLINSQML